MEIGSHGLVRFAFEVEIRLVVVLVGATFGWRLGCVVLVELYGYNFSQYHDNYNDLMFHKNRIAGGYESEKRSRESQLNSTQAELNSLNQEKSSVQNQISSSEREISRVQSENNWNKMLEENARKQKEQSSRQSQQIASQSLPSKQTAPVPLASPETIKNDLTDEQIVQMLKAHRKPTPTIRREGREKQ